MKKLAVLLAAFSLSAAPSLAQSVRLGPEVGVNVFNSTIHYEEANGRDIRETFDPRAGLKIGGIVDIGLGRHVSFQPGLFYSQKGYKYATYLTDVSVRLNYFEIPLNVLYHGRVGRGVSFFAGGGPYLAFGLGGNVDADPGGTRDIEFGSSRNDDYSGLDAGLNFNAGMEFDPGLFFRLNYGLGVANVVPEGGSNNREHLHGFTFSVGFLF